MNTTVKQYASLERQITKDDRAALKAGWDALLKRWKFGRKLVKARGDKERLSKGLLEAIYASVGNTHVTYDAYKMECSRRTRFAARYPTEAKVRAAFEKYGSWAEICARELGPRVAAEEVAADPLETLLSKIDGAAEDLRAALEDLRQKAVARIEVREADVHDVLTILTADRASAVTTGLGLLARLKEIRARRWLLLGRWPADRGLLKFV